MEIDIPNSLKIVEKAQYFIKKFEPDAFTKKYLIMNFCEVIELTFHESYKLYQKYETQFIARKIRKVLPEDKSRVFTFIEVEELSAKVGKISIELEKSLSQSRKSRAGRTFEIIVQKLLKICGINSERVTNEYKKKGLRRLDLVVPDLLTALNSPDSAHFLSLKTSLKDRWKLVIEDQKPGQRTHFLTLLQHETLSSNILEKIFDRGIILYIPDNIKIKEFQNDSRVRKLSELPSKLN